MIGQENSSQVPELPEYPSSSSPRNSSVEGWGSCLQILEKAEPFDLIEISRFSGLYQHWVMYLDSELVVHVTQVKLRTEGQWGEKRVDKLMNIARQDPCRINNHTELALEKGLEKLNKAQIFLNIEDAVNSLEGYKIVEYSAGGKNCEYYATSWRYGQGFSKQVEDLGSNIDGDVVQASIELLGDLGVP